MLFIQIVAAMMAHYSREVAFEEICRNGRVSRRDEATVSRSDESFAERRFRRLCSAMAFMKRGETLFPT
jgi:hypothetical protein